MIGHAHWCVAETLKVQTSQVVPTSGWPETCEVYRPKKAAGRMPSLRTERHPLVRRPGEQCFDNNRPSRSRASGPRRSMGHVSVFPCQNPCGLLCKPGQQE
jgi:hypothetical protein